MSDRLIATPHAGEYAAARLDAGDIEGAQVAQEAQYQEGFAAHAGGTDYQDFRPAAWQAGWLDAYELAEVSPAFVFRMSAEV